MNTIEIGLPFFDSINMQARNKPYFNAYTKEWTAPDDAFLPFQIRLSVGLADITTFNLVNVDTGASTDYLAHMQANASEVYVEDHYVIIYNGDVALSLTDGRWYFYVETNASEYRWSEVFQIRNLGITPSVTYKEFSAIEIGLPFFDNPMKQVVNKPYYNASLREWLTANNRLPSFQFFIPADETPTIITFNLVNYETGASTDFMSYFNTDVIPTLVSGVGTWFTHVGLTDVPLYDGKYYFHVISLGGMKWWSEVFVICGGITEPTNYLKWDNVDYALLDGADKLIIG